MNDTMIVDLYWNRDETAIKETEKKYSKYLMKIAFNVVGSLEDGKEIVNDTYLKAWNSMPTHRPNVLSAYLGKITRESSIDFFRKSTRKKRQGSQYTLSLSELEECISSTGGGSPEEEYETKLLTELIDKWLDSVSKEIRNVFVGRYYYMDSVKDVAAYCNMSESKTKSILFRARKGLKEFLEREGYVL
ncbi:MAG: sigma-70 family RNA polymerase sigma factor [Oscillospiraceae bacterium]|nr:sigma-70 family RNA polymerase sigma factor [Oscillospiraceae bacterium]